MCDIPLFMGICDFPSTVILVKLIRWCKCFAHVHLRSLWCRESLWFKLADALHCASSWCELRSVMSDELNEENHSIDKAQWSAWWWLTCAAVVCCDIYPLGNDGLSMIVVMRRTWSVRVAVFSDSGMGKRRKRIGCCRACYLSLLWRCFRHV